MPRNQELNITWEPQPDMQRCIDGLLMILGWRAERLMKEGKHVPGWMRGLVEGGDSKHENRR